MKMNSYWFKTTFWYEFESRSWIYYTRTCFIWNMKRTLMRRVVLQKTLDSSLEYSDELTSISFSPSFTLYRLSKSKIKPFNDNLHPLVKQDIFLYRNTIPHPLEFCYTLKEIHVYYFFTFMMYSKKLNMKWLLGNHN